MFYKKGALKHFVISTGTHACLRFFFDKVAIKWPTTMVSSKVFFNSCFKDAFSRSFVENFGCFFIIISLLCILDVSVSIYLAGCSLRLYNSRIASRFWKVASRNYHFSRKL